MNTNTEITTSLIDMTIASLLIKLININKIINHDEITQNISEIQTNLCTKTIDKSIDILNILNEEYDNKDINNLISVLELIKYTV